MKRVLFILAFISTALLSCAFSQDTTAAADSIKAPSIEFTETIHDFGKAGSDTTLSYTFIFSNPGNDSLRIRGVRPG